LQVVEDIASKLGEEYMALLPETVPFLAELMEGKITLFLTKCTLYYQIILDEHTPSEIFCPEMLQHKNS